MVQDRSEVAELQRKLVAAGYNSFVAEALAERGWTPERLAAGELNEVETLEEVLCWYGIAGYSRLILNSVDNIRNVAAAG